MLIELSVKKKGIEKLLVDVDVYQDGLKVGTKTIDLGGNATCAAHWGALKVVEALNDMKL